MTNDVLDYDGSGQYLKTFILRYLTKEDEGVGTENVWYNCTQDDVGVSTESFHSFTDPASVEIFLIVHAVMHIIWLLSLVTLFCRSKKWFVIWILSTLMVILYGAIVGCLFAIEIYDAVVSDLHTFQNTCAQQTLKLSHTLLHRIVKKN